MITIPRINGALYLYLTRYCPDMVIPYEYVNLIDSSHEYMAIPTTGQLQVAGHKEGPDYIEALTAYM